MLYRTNTRTANLLAISKTKLLSRIAIASFILFALSSTQEVYYNPAIKIIFDITRGASILIFIAFYAFNYSISRKMLIVGLFFLIWSISFKDWFFLDAGCGFILSILIIRLDKDKIIRSTAWWLILITTLTIVLAKLGLIQSATFTNTLYSDVAFSTGSKESLGFWQPNVVSLLIISCMISGFYLDDKKLIFTTVLVYLFIIQETVSRTYIPIPIVIFIYYSAKFFSLHRTAFFTLPILLLGITSMLIAWLVTVPQALSSFLGPAAITALDQLFSYRISIARRVIEPLSGIELMSGIHDKKIQIDSLFVNYIISQGLVLFFAVSLFVSYIMFDLFKRRKSKELLIISLYLLISNFESTASVSSLVFVIFIACCSEAKMFSSKKAHGNL